MLKETIRAVIEAAIAAAQGSGTLPVTELPPVEISRPKQAEHGDYSCNIAMILASSIRKTTGEKTNPRAIAQTIIDHIDIGALLSATELAGPGFINLRLADRWLQSQVGVIVNAGPEYGNLTIGEGQYWQVEYVSANPTGPIHYGGARNAVIGDVLANVLEACGYRVQREYYVNDGGTQFGLFTATLYARYMQALGHDVPLPENGYQGAYLVDYAQDLIDEYGARFVDMERTTALAELTEIGRAKMLPLLQDELGSMGVIFDNWYSEQSLYDSGHVEEVLEFLNERGDLVKRDGAVWFTASKYPKNEKDEVVIRSDGRPTYFAADIAYHYDKFFRRGFDKVVNVWAVDHQGHVPRMAAVMQALGLDPGRLIILMYDLVKLMRDGQEVKLSKRAGNVLTIGEVVEEVGADALRFNLMTRAPESTVEFDMDLAVQSTNENPVYYVQYGYARICSILDKAQAEGLGIHPGLDVAEFDDLGLLKHPSELALIRKLLEVEEQLEVAVDKLSPHNLTHYVLDLAKTFTAFYRDCKVVDPARPELSRARLYLSEATRIVIGKVLGLLGVSTPSSM